MINSPETKDDEIEQDTTMATEHKEEEYGGEAGSGTIFFCVQRSIVCK